MRAVLVERPGGLDQLRLAEVPDPVPAAGEVLIEVAFAGCNWATTDREALEAWLRDPPGVKTERGS